MRESQGLGLDMEEDIDTVAGGWIPGRRSSPSHRSTCRFAPSATSVVRTDLRYSKLSQLDRGPVCLTKPCILYGTVFAIQFLRNNPLLRKLLRTEPETLLPSLTIEAGAVIDFATEHSANLLRSDLYGDTPTTPQQERHLRTVAQLQTRITLSFVVTPHTSIKLENLDQAREYVRNYLMPMINGPSHT
jgi:Bacterial Tetracyclin repressor,  C-terminal domain